MKTLAFIVFLTASTVAAVFAGEADVIEARVTNDGVKGFTVSVTVRHDDSGWDHYADRWEVLGPDGGLLAERTLYHPHVDEQPFTRSLSGVMVPAGIRKVTIRARCSVHGYGGKDFTTILPH